MALTGLEYWWKVEFLSVKTEYQVNSVGNEKEIVKWERRKKSNQEIWRESRRLDILIIPVYILYFLIL